MYETILVFLLAVVTLSNATSVPFITKCKSDDTKCAKNSAQAAIPIFTAGLPEFDVERLEPLFFERIDSSTGNIKFILSNVTVTGLSKCQARKIHHDVGKAKMFLKFQCNSELEGQYELNGNVIFLTIEGNGRIHVKLNQVSISVESDVGEKIGKDGKKHWDLKNWKHSYELKDKAELVFENLFNGNKVLAQAANELMRDSPNEVVREIGTRCIVAVIEIILQNVNNLFTNVSSEDLSLD